MQIATMWNHLLLLRNFIKNGSSNPRFCSSQTLDPARRITDILTRNKDWLTLLESSEILNKLDRDVVRSVISQACASEPKKLVNFFLWSQTKSGNYLKDLDLHSFLAVSLCNSGSIFAASRVIERIVRVWKFPLGVLGSVAKCFREEQEEEEAYLGSKNPIVFEILMNGYRKSGFPVEAGYVLLGLRSVEEFKPGLVSCNLLLRDLLKANKFEMLFEVFNRMSEMKIGLDVYTYTSLVSAHFRSGNVDAAKRVFSEMGEKDLVSYNRMIDGLCNAELVKEAMEMKTKMIEKGISPDKYTYSFLITGFVKKNKLKEAFEIKEEMVAHGFPVDSYVCRTLLYGVCKAGNEMDKASNIFDEMVGLGVEPDSKLYTLLIEGFCRSWKMKRAFEMFDEMKRKNVEPSVVTYAALVKGSCDAGDFDRAKLLIEEMGSLGLRPDSAIYNTVIFARLKEGKPEEAKRTLKTMMERGISPDEITYNCLITGFCMIGDFGSAKAYLDEMSAKNIRPTERVYRAFIRNYVKAGDTRMANEYLEEMQSRLRVPHESTYKDLINSHRNADVRPVVRSRYPRRRKSWDRIGRE